ncbi:hypothetical protein T4A_6262 [Trichinella pseudospiralis]|uniref:Uncharacterized protein n=1 Tax=Trichinella pseudospiralis TaxID=6337 RepID=A0A0V1DMV4_TRIPS|nr:hypothetical protein T4A_6262 [Trichinella pseudospiralis]
MPSTLPYPQPAEITGPFDPLSVKMPSTLPYPQPAEITGPFDPLSVKMPSTLPYPQPAGYMKAGYHSTSSWKD